MMIAGPRTRMFAILFVLAFQMTAGTVSASGRTLIYRLTDDQSGDITGKTYVQINSLPSGGKAFDLRTEGDDYAVEEKFTLDQDYITRSFSRIEPGEDTDYAGEKKEHTVFLKGKFKGQNIDKRIDLDDKPFYDNPEFNLAKFVLSGDKHIKFWMLRKDLPVKVQMQAKKREEESVLINGREMDVIKVVCTRSGVHEKYLKHFFYFRKSDGLFVKKVTSKGSAADLLSEQ